MKKRILIFVFLIVMCSGLFFASCEKKEEEMSGEEPLEIHFEKMDEDSASIIIRLCYNEMEGEPLLAKTAFCAMILNRMESEYFPDTADGVVFEPGAFVSTQRSSFYSELNAAKARRDRLALYYALEKECDPTEGALFCRKTSDPECYELTPSLTVADLVFGNP